MSNQRGSARSKHHTVRRVMSVETLDERVTLDADGFEGSGLGVADPLPWFDPAALTYSFAPDGTSVAGQQSVLFEQLAELGDDADWQSEFDSAFNAWLSPLGARTAQVTDSGDAVGTNGPTQGDMRFGDVRIAAIPLSTGVHATSIPHSAMAQGTWAGDILLNANVQWNSLQDLYAVALHEYGHVLGLGHSVDPTSPLFVHGVHDVAAPTTDDVAALQDLYAGIRFENEDDKPRSDKPRSIDGDDGGTPASVLIDRGSVIVLQPTMGSSIRYSATNEIVDPQYPIVFGLQPTTVDAEDLENLTIALRSTDFHRLSADVKVIDASGNEVESQILHHGQGNVVVQAMGVESDEDYFVMISPSHEAHPLSQIGAFEIVADYGPELRLSREIGEIQLKAEHPAIDIPLSVTSSRLVHIHLESAVDNDSSSQIRAVLLDSENRVLTRVAMLSGTSRSAPLTFLPNGEYTLRIVGSSDLEILLDTQLRVFIDEVSIDVGPGVSDPTGTPYLSCDEPGANPDFCSVYQPIIPGDPTPSEQDAPETVADQWWWDYGYDCSDYTAEQFTEVQLNDPLWWSFYSGVCAGGDSPTNPTSPTTPTLSPGQPTTSGPAAPSIPSQPNDPINSDRIRLDVSNDGNVSPLDALLVINYMSRNRTAELSAELALDAAGQKFDANGDLHVSIVDALVIINAIDSARNLEAEQVDSAMRQPLDLISIVRREELWIEGEASQLF